MDFCRLPYTIKEDKAILRYLIDGGHLRNARGNAIWKTLEEDNVCPNRSWQSLKNRFRRTIILDCSRPEYGLTKEEKEDLKVHLSSWMVSQPNIIHTPRNNSLLIENYLPEDGNSSDTDVSIELVASPPSQPTKRDRSITPKEKQFYSLDMEWSDSDSD